MEDLIEKFSLERLNPAPAAINFSKLDHFNGLHIRSLAPDDLAGRLQPFLSAPDQPVDHQKLLDIIPIIRERLTTLDDVLPVAGFFFQEEVQPRPEKLIGADMTANQSARAARRAYQLLQPLAEISLESAEPLLRLLADELGIKAGQLFGILRVAVTGQPVSPPLFESMAIIGKEKVMRRLQHAITVLESLAQG
jgi:glutamyl-tRNA synthetase